jgi:hypothetical protein
MIFSARSTRADTATAVCADATATAEANGIIKSDPIDITRILAEALMLCNCFLKLIFSFSSLRVHHPFEVERGGGKK